MFDLFPQYFTLIGIISLKVKLYIRNISYVNQKYPVSCSHGLFLDINAVWVSTQIGKHPVETR